MKGRSEERWNNRKAGGKGAKCKEMDVKEKLREEKKMGEGEGKAG